MDYQEVEIFVAPTRLFWVEIPNSVDNSMRLELFKNNILLIPVTLEELDALAPALSEADSLALINLDSVFQKMQSTQSTPAMLHASRQLITHLRRLNAKRSVLHTTNVSSELTEYFRSEQVPYLQKNMGMANVALPILTNYQNYFLNSDPKRPKAYVSVRFAATQRGKAAIQNLSRKGNPISVNVESMNTNGMTVRFQKEEEILGFQVKDIIALKANIGSMVIRLQKALVRQKSEEKLALNLYFDINNVNMIGQADSDLIAGLVSRAVEDVIASEGKAADLSFVTYRPTNARQPAKR